MNTERRGQRNQKGRAGAKPHQGPTWTLHLHCCLGRPGQKLRGPAWPEGLGKPGSGQVSIQSWDGDASILHSSPKLGKSMHPPQGAGGNALALNAALPSSVYLRASGTRLPSAPSYCRCHFQFLLLCISSQPQQTLRSLALDMMALCPASAALPSAL